MQEHDEIPDQRRENEEVGDQSQGLRHLEALNQIKFAKIEQERARHEEYAANEFNSGASQSHERRLREALGCPRLFDDISGTWTSPDLNSGSESQRSQGSEPLPENKLLRQADVLATLAYKQAIRLHNMAFDSDGRSAERLIASAVRLTSEFRKGMISAAQFRELCERRRRAAEQEKAKKCEGD